MSQLLINDYLKQLDVIKRVSGSQRETIVREAFKDLPKSDPAAGSITLDSETTLRGVPPEAWAYKLGNRCAIDWVLDQHKEKKPKDPTIRERFNTYRFADHKEKVVDLLARVTTVSVETVKITEAMKGAAR
jgi:predicted helicase